jgi:hypothetical protein
MVVVMAMLVIGVVVLGLFVAAGLRRWTLAEARTEASLHQPGAKAVSYLVPPGQDPAVLMAALMRAGYTAVTDTKGGVEHVLVACPQEGDRAEVRKIIEGVHRAGFDGPEMHVGHVSFDDER